MFTDDDIVAYITSRWTNLKTRAQQRRIRQVINAVAQEERASDFPRTTEQVRFDVLVRVTQIYEETTRVNDARLCKK